MTRIVTVCLAVLLCAGHALAEPQPGALPNGATLDFKRLLLNRGTEDSPDFQEPEDSDALKHNLNFANCECTRMGLGAQKEMRYEMGIQGVPNSHQVLQVWFGSQCDDPTVRSTQCFRATEGPDGLTKGEITDLNSLTIAPADISFSSFELVNGFSAQMLDQPCQQREGDGLLWLLYAEDGATISFATSKAVGSMSSFADVKGIDTQPPSLVTEVKAAGGEATAELTWTPAADRPTDIAAYQVLCLESDTRKPITDTPDIKPLYVTTGDVCGIPQTFPADALAVPGITGETALTAAPSEFATLDPKYLCASTTQPGNGITVKGLKNNVKYELELLMIDFYGNVRAAFIDHTVTPIPVTDLWEDIHDRGGDIDGGFCLLAETYGDQGPITRALRAFRDDTLGGSGFGRLLTRGYYATIGKLGFVVRAWVGIRVLAAVMLAPLVAFALLWHLLSLPVLLLLLTAPWWLRRVARRLPRWAFATGALGAVCVMLPRAAHADDFAPYWEGEVAEDAPLADIESLVRWHVGIRVGPYTPDIDKALPANANGVGPYRQMFGNYRIGDNYYDAHVYQFLPMLDVDRVVLHLPGLQLLGGGSIGYLRKTAHAYTMDSKIDDVVRDRSPSSDNSFNLVPLAALATVRLTVLDEQYGIPVVPYAKAGLSYYIWWMKGPDGSLSSVCKDGSMTDGCDKNTAAGASLGFQGSVGLSIRAERIDADAARSMTQSGIYHAGFFGELSYAKVDGFGSSGKLSVGGRTWFAGAEFEF